MRRLFVALLFVVLAFALAVLAGRPTANANLQLVEPAPPDPATFVGNGGYSADGLGQNGIGGTIQADVAAGSTAMTADAAVTTVPEGCITIAKNTVPPNPTGFMFPWTATTPPPNSVVYDGRPGIPLKHGGSERLCFPSGTHVEFWERQPLPPGWTLVDITCTGTGGYNILIGSDGDFDPGDTGVAMNLGPAADVTCTFTNRQAPCTDPDGENISTGINLTAGIGSADPRWKVSSGPAGPTAYAVKPSAPPFVTSPWVAPPIHKGLSTNWIDPNNTSDGAFLGTNNDPVGGYVYDTSFTVPSGFTGTLTFQFAADEDVTFDLSGPSIASQTAAFSILYGLIKETRGPGTYELSAHVANNATATDDNPTGLLVVGTVTCVLGGGDQLVGGTFELRADGADASALAASGSGSPEVPYAAIAGGAAAAAAVVLALSGWYVRRRWLP